MSLKSTGAGDASTGFYPHTIDQSLRFEDGDNPKLSRTPSSAGNQKTWTWSGWIKRGNLGSEQTFFMAYKGINDYVAMQFDSGDEFNITYKNIGQSGGSLSTQTRRKITTAKFRDVSAWYNIVVKFDAANTNCDIYINGTEVTDFSVNEEPQNLNFAVNEDEVHYIGASENSVTGVASTHFDGYLAEINLVDGTALDASSFGETKAGIWIPKDTSGLTFGTNGFRLKFQDSSSLVDDTSGEGHDFDSTSGLAATDVVLDSPTNNFATLNPLYTGSASATFSEGNLKNVTPTSGYGTAIATIVPQSGKYYAEFIGVTMLGIRDVTLTASNSTALTAGSTKCIGYFSDGRVFTNGTTVLETVDSFSTTDVVAITIDYDSSEVKWYVNNTLKVTKSSLDLTNVTFAVGDFGNSVSNTILCNFGQDSANVSSANSDENGIGTFEYAPPSGFLALCSDNLPNPDIDPAEDEEPADYFNTVLYSGNNTQLSVTGVGFQPDWVWIKKRNGASSHALQDSVRGAVRYVVSNSDAAENTDSGNNWFRSFDSDGFTVSKTRTDGTETTEWNNSGDTYVSWNWLAGGTPSTIEVDSVSSGVPSVQSSVSANTEAGFSIVTHDNGSGTRTVGHGLNSTPELIIEKKRDATGDWLVQTTLIDGSNDYLRLNTTAAKANGSGASPTSTVYSPNVGGGADCLAYCFHSVEGYSKVGTYTGNGSTDGTFVYTGFRPAWLLVKRTDSTADWIIWDIKRSVHNEVTGFLYPNLNIAEPTGSSVLDFLSNGFKLRNAGTSNRNASGGTYLYLAFADQPFKYSNAL